MACSSTVLPTHSSAYYVGYYALATTHYHSLRTTRALQWQCVLYSTTSTTVLAVAVAARYYVLLYTVCSTAERGGPGTVGGESRSEYYVLRTPTS